MHALAHTCVATSPRPPLAHGTYCPWRRVWFQCHAGLDARHAAVNKIKDRAGWLKRQATVRQNIGQLFYPLPPTGIVPPYNVTGVVRHPDGFIVKKIIYQTRPGLWVTGALWIPAELESSGKKAPGIVLTSGHAQPAWRWTAQGVDCAGPADNCTQPVGGWPANPGGYQLVCWNLVHKGFVVLAFDPIGQGERQEYVGEKIDGGKAWGTFEHEYLARQLFLVGRSAASFWHATSLC